MNCDEARAAFTDLYDGALAGVSLAALTRHLDRCQDCRREWAAFRDTMRALTDLGPEDPSRDFAARIARQIEAPRWWWRVLGAAVFPLPVKLPLHAAALAVLCLAGLWMFQGSPEIQRATDVRAPAAPERPASTMSPVPSGTPPASRSENEAARRPPATLPRTFGAPSPAPPSEGKLDAPATMGEPEGVPQLPPTQDSMRQSAVPPPAAVEKRAESESAVHRRLRSAPTPQESQERTDARPPAAPEAAGTTGGLSASSRGTADEMFAAASAAFAAREYERAIAPLRAFLAQHPGDSRAADARFLLAEAYRATTRYAEARAELEAFLRQHPDHREASIALYRHGEVALLLGDPAGCALLRAALSRYANAREAPAAREMLSARCP
jgi:TolA-binding protein